MSEANKALIRWWLEEVDNVNWTTLRAEILAPDLVVHFPSNPQPLTLDEYEQTDRMLWTAFPDLRHTVEQVIAEGDLVAERSTVRGTHKAEFQGVAPTGKAVTVTTIAVARVAGGRIVEVWAEADMLGLMQQIGAIPATQAAS